ncbi:uncharacterized protein LOC112538473 isoform X3 [Tetranychus urticae]|uniref:uncharacterized protein LOC112538473 isoform X3 n=1 Tax=Tetranychus urticae TaxID=32264 RepID=UPI000D6564EE|nr:uncharacterized protein LOC112538473 isoform X3 [Tetranychus urticae]
MLINELPEDCFVEIFDYIQDLKDLINCFKVCEKWSNLIVARTKKVKYFIDRPNHSPDSVFQQSDEPIDVAFLSEWFPNLRIFDFSNPFFENVPKEDIAKLIRDGLEEPFTESWIIKLFPDFVLHKFVEYNVNLQSDEPDDITSLVEWFSNLRIANLSYPSHVKPAIEDIDKLIRNSESLKGIICGGLFESQLMRKS